MVHSIARDHMVSKQPFPSMLWTIYSGRTTAASISPHSGQLMMSAESTPPFISSMIGMPGRVTPKTKSNEAIRQLIDTLRNNIDYMSAQQRHYVQAVLKAVDIKRSR
eukprot:5936867-Amphidinium_carterae.1